VQIAALLSAVAQVQAASGETPLALRGCVALGDLALSGNYLLGPAIDEAADGERWADAAVVWISERASDALALDMRRSGSAKSERQAAVNRATMPIEIPGHAQQRRAARVVVPFAVPGMDPRLFTSRISESFGGDSLPPSRQEKLRKTMASYRAMAEALGIALE